MTPSKSSITLLVLLSLLCHGCGGYGTKLTFKKGSLYYTSDITGEEAQAVGSLLEKEGYFSDSHPCAVQVAKEKRVYQVRFVVREGVETDETLVLPYRSLGAKVSKDALRSAPVDVHLCDEKLSTLKVIPYSPPKPELPVFVSFRRSIGGSSLVARYNNHSDKYMTILVTLTNPTLNQSRRETIDIKPNRTTEHGWAEGWSYKSGEKIFMYHADYEPRTTTVP